MKERNGVLLAVKLIFILSLVVLIYSVVQVVKAPIEAKQALNDWAKKREETVAHSRSAEETPLPLGMVSSAKEQPPPAHSYTEGEIIGEIRFPKLNKKIAVLEGTESPELKKGAGHYKGSAAIGAINVVCSQATAIQCSVIWENSWLEILSSWKVRTGLLPMK